MDNPWSALDKALAEARELETAIRNQSNSLARLMIGRLRSVDNTDTLRALKRELAKFDAVRGKWKP
jgi:hypothetical protein